MFKYLQYSDIAVRINLSPFNWCWLPFFTVDKPTAFFPKRHTFGVGWLFIQLFLDIDDGTRDFASYSKAFFHALDDIEVNDDSDNEHKVGDSVSKLGKGSVDLE